ncbi:MAG: hypothetical protein IT579_13430 [Verrucomicrobia subdivision 3 bacterium]|nr:hypothetical protein [Limisphaerales bacterium]
MKKTLAFIILLAALAVSAWAESLLSDDFNYPNGAIVGAAGSPWVNNSGTAGSMIATNNPPNGQLEVNFNRGEDIAAQFPNGPYMSNGPVAAVYSKFTVHFISPPSGVGTYFAHFTGEGMSTDYRARILASVTNVTTTGNAAAGNFFLGVANNSGTIGLSVPFPTELTTNVTYTVVTKYELATGLSTLWIDPTDESSASVTATLNPSLTNPKYYGFRQASGEGIMRIDNLRVATSFSSVAGANTDPTISAIPNQSIPQNGNTGALPFTVGDAESDPSTLTVATASTNTTLVPLSGIIINDGDGTNRTVTVTPATGQQGTTRITLTVSDGTNASPRSFVVTVGGPIISAIPNQIAVVNAVIPPIAFTITDAEGDTLTPTKTSSNTNLLKSENITITGTGLNRTLTLVPEPNTNGVTTVTLRFSDGFTTSTRSFALTVSPVLGILLQDQFTYTSFNFSPNSLYDAVGSPWQTVSGTAYEVQSTNGWAYLSAALGEDLAAPLTNSAGSFPLFTNYPPAEGDVFYSSFTLKVTSLPEGDGDYFAHYRNTATTGGTTFRAKVFVSTNGATPGSYRIGIANQANAGTYYALDCNLDTDYFVVTRYNSPIGETTLWVNPLAESTSYITGTDALQTAPIGAYGLRQSSGIGNLQISNLVVSTSFPMIATPAAITITSISVASGTVTVNFDAGNSDTPSGFDLIASGAVNGSYAPVSATITNPSAGKFQATTSTVGDTQFYQIKRN